MNTPAVAASSEDAVSAERARTDADALRLKAVAAAQLIRTEVNVAWKEVLPWAQQTEITMVVASADPANVEASLSRGGQFRVEREVALIGRRVRASLSGPDVEITPDTPIERDVTPLGNVTFQWKVRPSRPGRTVLTARIENGVEVKPGEFVWVEHEPAYEHVLAVRMGLLDWLTWWMNQVEGLKWFLGGMAAGLAFILANRRKIRLWWKLRRGR